MQTGREADAVRSNNAPPSARKVVCVDFDGTIYPWGRSLFGDEPPFPHVKAAMLALKRAGYHIVILTSRASQRWWKAEEPEYWAEFGTKNIRYVTERLDKDGIPWDEVTAEKVPAEAYFDDKAWQVCDVHGSLPNAIVAFLNGEGVCR